MITIQEENFYDMFPESVELRDHNFEDNPLPIQDIQLDLDVTKYKIMAQQGTLLVVTARDEGKLIGYYSSVVQPHLHFAKILFGLGDAYVVHRAYRGKGIGAKMFAHVEKLWRDRGAKIGLVGTREKSAALFKAGWIPSEYRYVKLIGEL